MPNPIKVDRRVKRTRRRLRDALIELILQQGYAPITIQDITDKADLSRATFYLHYKDKDELLASSLEEMFDELVASVGEMFFRRTYAEQAENPPSVLAFSHVAEYAPLYKSLFSSSGVTYVISRTIQYVARITQKQLETLIADLHLPPPTIPLEVVSQHTAGALFALVAWWVEQDMPYPPVEMARMFHQMAFPTLQASLNLPNTLPSKL